MRILNTVYVTSHRARVRYTRGSLVVDNPEGAISKIPIATVEGIVLLGNAQVTSQTLTECTRRGIRIAAIGRGGRLRFAVGAPISGNVHLRLAQYRAAEAPGASTLISRAVVAGKIQNCRRMVLRWEHDARDNSRWTLNNTQTLLKDRLDSLSHSTDPDRIRGIEGDATRRYFQALRAALHGTGFIFGSRTRRPPRDPVNSLLSWTYALVTAEVAGALDAIGLDPQVGFLHRPRPGRPALALDIVEELRPAIADRFVVSLLRRRMVNDSHFTYTPGGACYLSDDGRTVALTAYEQFRQSETPHLLLDRSVPRWSLPTIQSTLMARHLRGDLPAYPPYVMAV